jgi:glycosyltransferase involved in cell wall biosynthesis
MPEDRVVLVPNGVPLTFSRRAAGELDAARREFPALGAGGPIVGMLASMRPRKGPEVLLRAFPAIAREFPGVRLLMVGSGEFVESTDYLKTLKSLAMSLGIPDRVVFTGHRDDPTLMLALMDTVVLPSLFGEGLPLVILEAMALGKPVVASRTEGNDEAVRDGVNGLLTPAGDDAALSEAILSLLRDPARARAMGEEGRRIAEAEYDIAIMARRYEAAYSRVTERDALRITNDELRMMNVE